MPHAGLISHFAAHAAKNHHSHLEASIKSVNARIQPARFHLFYNRETTCLETAWEDFLKFVYRFRDQYGVKLDESLLDRLLPLSPILTKATMFALGVDAGEQLVDSRIKFGFVADPNSDVIKIFTTDPAAPRLDPPLLDHVRTAGCDLTFDGQSRVKLYPGFNRNELTIGKQYYDFSRPVLALLELSPFFFIASHVKGQPVQIELLRDQVHPIVPVAEHPVFREHEHFVLGIARSCELADPPDSYNLYY